MGALSTIHDITGRRLVSSIYSWDIYASISTHLVCKFKPDKCGPVNLRYDWTPQSQTHPSLSNKLEEHAEKRHIYCRLPRRSVWENKVFFSLSTYRWENGCILWTIENAVHFCFMVTGKKHSSTDFSSASCQKAVSFDVHMKLPSWLQ
jgi:hypothetical protein